MAMDFRTETVADLAGRVQEGELSARELTEAALGRIDSLNEKVNAFVALDAEDALAQADAIDQRRAAGEDVGPLAGIPIGVKDLEDAAGFVTTYGSAVHAEDPPADGDSVLVERLRQAGCVVLGKTNTPEFGYKGDTTNPVFGATHNPWNLHRSAGGSSGGSAAAIAAGMVPLCTGSDGGGSIRIPSSACGLAGFKPSLGRVPGGGGKAPSWGDLSTRGVMACKVRDIALALDAVIGPDPSDLRSLPMPEQSWIDAIDDLHSPRRVVWSPTLGYGQVDREVADLCRSAVEKLEAGGTEVITVDSVFASDPGFEWLTLAMLGTLRNLVELRGTPEWNLLDPEHVSLMELVERRAGPLDVLRAQDRAHSLNLRLVELFHKASFLLVPTVAGQPGEPGEQGTIDGKPDPNWVAFTYPFNLTRSPAGTIPVGTTAAGVPVGLQVIGPQHADVAVLRVLAVLEELLGFVDRAPIE